MPLFADPIAAGVNAFRGISDVITQQKELGMRRELMERQKAESAITMERERLGLEQQKQDIAFKSKMSKIFEDHPELLDQLDPQQVNNAFEKTDRISQGKDEKYTDNEVNAFFTLLPSIGHIDLDKLDEQADATNDFRKWMATIAPSIYGSPKQKIVIDRNQIPEQIANFEKIYGNRINTGSDKNGLTVEKDGVKKSIKKVLIDKTNPEMPTVSFVLDVDSPVKEGQVFKHIGDANPRFTVNPTADGMIEQGNIDLSKRPVVRNKDGSISTLLTTGFGIAEGGKDVEVLIPLVSDNGKIMTREEAIEKYKKDGKHLGKFRTIADASRYAEQLHSDPMWNEDIKRYSVKGQESTHYDDAPMTHDHGPDPNAPVVRLPIPILDAQLFQTQRAFNTLRQIQAQRNPEEMLKLIEGAKTKRQENEAIRQAKQDIVDYMQRNPKASTNIVRARFESTVLRLYPGMDQKTLTSFSKDIIPEKGIMTEYQGRLLQQRAEIETAKEKDTAEKRKAEEKKETAREKEKGEELGLKKRELDIKEKDLAQKRTEKAEKEKEKDLSVGERRELNQEIFGRYSNLLPPDMKHEQRKSVIASKSADTLIGNLSPEHQEAIRDIRDRAVENKREDKKLTWNQAISKAEKEIGKPQPILMPTPKDVYDAVVKKYKSTPNSPEKKRRMEEEVRKQGFDPERME